MSMKSIPVYNNTVLFSAFVLSLGSLKRASFECSETSTVYKDKKNVRGRPLVAGPSPSMLCFSKMVSVRNVSFLSFPSLHLFLLSLCLHRIINNERFFQSEIWGWCRPEHFSPQQQKCPFSASCWRTIVTPCTTKLYEWKHDMSEASWQYSSYYTLSHGYMDKKAICPLCGPVVEGSPGPCVTAENW